jgi:hypothetical protein
MVQVEVEAGVGKRKGTRCEVVATVQSSKGRGHRA